MRVLLAISILAFLALLWASIAIFRHIRRAQRRRRRAKEAARNNLTPPVAVAIVAPPPPPPVVPEITFSDPEDPILEFNFTDTQAPARETPPPAPVSLSYIPKPEASKAKPVVAKAAVEVRPKEVPAVVTPPAPAADIVAVTTAVVAAPTKPAIEATADEFVDTLPPPPATAMASKDPALSPLPYWPNFGFTPSRFAPLPKLEMEHDDELDPPATTLQPQPEPIPYAGIADSSTAVTPVRLPIVIHPPPPAIKPIYPSSPYPTQQEATQLQAAAQVEAAASQQAAALRSRHQPSERADWTHFNKNMGDLTDPPPAGSRARVPIHVPQTPNKSKSD